MHGSDEDDGLAFADGALIAHHPLSFWRVARYELDPTWRRIVGRRLLEANTPDGRTSTTGEVVGDDYVVRSGVQAGERVIVSGVQKLGDGAAVQPEG